MDKFPAAKAIYAVREPHDCIASFTREFGDYGRVLWINRLKEAAQGELGRLLSLSYGSTEQAKLISDLAQETFTIFSLHDPTTPNLAAAYFYFQHSFYFRLGLNARENILLIDYNNMIRYPDVTMRALCCLLEIDFVQSMTADWKPGRGFDGADGAPNSGLLTLCISLYNRILASKGITPT